MNELIKLMESKGYNQAELARKLDVSDGYIKLLRDGKRNPSRELIIKIKSEFRTYKDVVTLADVVWANLVR